MKKDIQIFISKEQDTEEIKKLLAELINANNKPAAFLYSVWHVLLAPLQHIRGFVDLLSSSFFDSLPEKAKYYLDIITDSTKQMGMLIDDLL